MPNAFPEGTPGAPWPSYGREDIRHMAYYAADTVAAKKMNGSDDNKMLQGLVSYRTVCVGLRVGVGTVAGLLFSALIKKNSHGCSDGRRRSAG
ncbi:hypothetical protein Y032_0086g1980 [Ancylostoma ceylanicum]|uniref:Uncharacterized protein n=1 Tax=Ancylostoma ceylanicum TaxID=53326 RepID=A0A016TPQ9_9BILA|nr:hypothetical protein Y032_0086g1980 [Ancylostoma ceylanicum]